MTALFIDIFDQIAQQRADHPAVITDGTQVTTYAALRAQAIHIAAHIPSGPTGRVVAISIEKSSDYLAAVLACWYARASFMPLDPSLPAQRRAHILAEAQPVCMLMNTKNDSTLNINHLGDRDFTPTAPPSGDTTAYVIYTSGSTGTPKGVIVSHRALVPVLQEQIKLFDINADTRSLFYLSTSFDASISDFGTALLAGATLCIESAGKIDTAANLAQVIAARGITYIDLPPALLRLLDPARMPKTLRSICIGGEVCPPAVVRQWAQDRRIVCVYGPTEATICTSASICDPVTWQTPLIGAPLHGVTYSIRDTQQQLCDDGELYIGGTQLADGYLAQPDLTAQKFVIIDGHRWYRSGDHVRRTPAGIEFLGRIDRQFKWRGQLVEPEEIEQALCRIQGISRAALVRDNSHGAERLVAHIECSPPLDSDHIRQALGKTLPAWMIPTHIVQHASMPLTTTGKINRAALALRNDDSADNITAPFIATGAQEEKLLACWQRVLGRADIPAQASFTALGGDSFSTLQLLLEAEKENLPLSPDFVTRHKTIAAQTRNLHDIQASNTMQNAQTLRPHVLGQFPVPVAPARTLADGDILLTGATGFLGRQLLLRLLEHTDKTIHVLLRAATPAHGLQRLNLPVHMQTRLRIICGDITQENCGLAADCWRDLADSITTIIHCAATVNMAQSYDMLEDANVRALHTLLCLAAQGRHKHIHHASTLSVFVATDRNHGCALESDSLDGTHDIYGGYAQSKWAAEILLHAAREKGHSVTVHRLGLVTGDSVGGTASPHDFLRTFMQGVISLGHIPAGDHADLLLDVTPVDYAADMMAQLIMQHAQGTFHIANTRGFSWPQLMAALARHGHALTSLKPDQWTQWLAQRRLQHPLTPEESATVMAMCRALPPPAFEHHRAMDLFQATGIDFDMTALRATLGPAWCSAPLADDALLDLYIHKFQLRPIAAKKASIA